MVLSPGLTATTLFPVPISIERIIIDCQSGNPIYGISQMTLPVHASDLVPS